MSRKSPLIVCLLFAFSYYPCYAQVPTPKVLDKNYTLELFAAEPDIVTPIGMAFDKNGRLLVIESHTHFRPDNYQGPKTDRVRIVEDTNNDGKADRFSTFHEGSSATMSIAIHPSGTVFIATRAKIFQAIDTDNDGKADKEKTIIQLQTPGNYPHNGLCGLAFDNIGWLYFGLGENLGEPYKIIGTDGIVLQGGGEGGNIYRCKPDGSKLLRIATGLWNPFGICIDPYGRVFTVENDPDSSPPCRLLHVVGGGDYGYQFRYGRSGLHPLQAWNGELPGTLPMLAGTGEAPGDVLPHRGDLWVTSWGDHRIERYTLKPHGASWQANMHTVVQGDKYFRPVGFALAPDGSLYFSDWVDRSYPVHGKGRVWRLVPKKNAPNKKLPSLTDAEKLARKLEKVPTINALRSDDPFVRQAAIWGFIQSGKLPSIDWNSLKNPTERLAVLQAWRWQNQNAGKILPQALVDPNPDVRLTAVRWVADERRTKYRSEVLKQFQIKNSNMALTKAAAAAIPWLDQRKLIVGRKGEGDAKLLLPLIKDANQPTAFRTWALRLMPVDHPTLSLEYLWTLIKGKNAQLRDEGLWTLLSSEKKQRFAILEKLAKDPSFPIDVRADAVSGLALKAGEFKSFLLSLAKSKNKALRDEAIRCLRTVGGSGFTLPDEQRPSPEDIDGWVKLLGQPGDPKAGRRIFYSLAGPNCAGCHAIAGRGASFGPDLSLTGKKLTKARLIESIIQPSKEVAPLFRTWLVETKDGLLHTGFSLGKIDQERKERFVNNKGGFVDVPVDNILAKHASNISIMPDGLEKTMTIEDFRNLLAFLSSEGDKGTR